MPIKARYPVIIDYDRDITQQLCANGYQTLASPIVLRQIIEEEKGIVNLTVAIFTHQTLTITAGVLWSMSAHLSRPLRAIELLCFGEQHPDLQLMMPIIALGTTISLGNVNYVLGLTSWDGVRALRLFPLDTEWPPEYTFAGTRK